MWHNDKILIGYDKAKFEEIPNEIDFTLGSNLVFKEAVFNDENLTAKSRKILKEKKKDLEKELKLVNEPEYIEEQARKQLKLVKPGEIIYIIDGDKKDNDKKNKKQ